ncbi:MAG: type III-A CRISPR-associated RAMP protein Csm4 [Chloroherpetonaceae bacterium]
MNAILLYPKNYAQFRLGEGSLDESGDMLHSDTLFSALANIYALAFEKADEFIQLVETGKLRFSSGLFGLEFVKEKKRIYFVPKPELNYETEKQERKQIKKIQFVSLGVLKEFAKRNNDTIELNVKDYVIIGGKFLTSKEEVASDLENKKFISIQTAPKVFVRKEVKEDAFYHESNLQFLPIQSSDGETIAKGFFYVLFEHSLSETELQEFQAAVRLLADEGIGGSRSTGCGHIEEVRFEEIAIENSGQSYLGLSLVSPNNDAEFKSAEQYDLLMRGGGSMGEYGNYKKHRKRARFIREGAVYNSPIQGKLVDVSPDENALPHKILRNGINFSIPF